MKARGLIGGLLGLLIGVVLFGGIVAANYFTTPTIYSGKILFTNEVEYENFKSALLGKAVTIRSLNSLSSDKHLVDFTITVPRGSHFNYGEEVVINWGVVLGMGIVGCAVLCFVGYAVSSANFLV